MFLMNVYDVYYIVMTVRHKMTKHHEVCLIKVNVHLLHKSKNAFYGIDNKAQVSNAIYAVW